MTTAFIAGVADCSVGIGNKIGKAANAANNLGCLAFVIMKGMDGAETPSRRRAAPRGRAVLHLLRFRFAMKDADPFSVLLNPNASAVVGAGYVLAVGSRLHLRFVGHDSQLRMWEDHLDL